MKFDGQSDSSGGRPSMEQPSQTFESCQIPEKINPRDYRVADRENNPSGM